MNRALLLSVALLAATVTAGAQSTARTSAPQPDKHAAPMAQSRPPAACPISIHAQHAADGKLMQVQKNRPAPHRDSRHRGTGQALQITLSRPGGPRITEALIRVHGFAPRGRLLSALTGRARTDAVRTMAVRLKPMKDGSSTARLWVPQMSAVDSITVETVTYADGTTRRIAHPDACHAPVDHTMLIAGQEDGQEAGQDSGRQKKGSDQP